MVKKHKQNVGKSFSFPRSGSSDVYDPDFPDFDDPRNEVRIGSEGEYRVMRKQGVNKKIKKVCRRK